MERREFLASLASLPLGGALYGAIENKKLSSAEQKVERFGAYLDVPDPQTVYVKIVGLKDLSPADIRERNIHLFGYNVQINDFRIEYGQPIYRQYRKGKKVYRVGPVQRKAAAKWMILHKSDLKQLLDAAFVEFHMQVPNSHVKLKMTDVVMTGCGSRLAPLVFDTNSIVQVEKPTFTFDKLYFDDKIAFNYPPEGTETEVDLSNYNDIFAKPKKS